MAHKTKVVRIGNSRGIRIPKGGGVLEQCHLTGEVELQVQGNQLVLRSARRPRADWDDAFREMRRHRDDAMLDQTLATQWDQSERQW
jgi:antitoxin MazE